MNNLVYALLALTGYLLLLLTGFMAAFGTVSRHNERFERCESQPMPWEEQ